jgi:hypothetical protein
MLPAAVRRTTLVELSDARVAAGLLLAGGSVQTLLPHPVGPSCPLRAATGIPCPLCGMTTGVTAAVDLRLADAFAANPAGIVAVVVALLVLGVQGRTAVSLPAWLVPTALALMWLFELHRFGVL